MKNNHTMKKTIIILSFLLAAIIACTVWSSCKKEEIKIKGKIYGTVTDFATGEPVSNVNVEINPIGEATLTGMDGSFQFDDLEEGKYSLSFSKDGYVDLNDSYVIELSEGRSVQRNVQLKESFFNFSIFEAGIEADTLDFGYDPQFNSITVSCKNIGTAVASGSAYFKMSHTWLSFNDSRGYSGYYNERSSSVNLEPGESIEITIYLTAENRDYLNSGMNIAYLTVSIGGVSKKCVIKAIGLSEPIVENPVLSNIADDHRQCMASSSVISTGGAQIVDKGFEYQTVTASGAINYYVNTLSVGSGNFSATLNVTSGYQLVKIRAYASNLTKTGYSDWVFLSDYK